MKWTEKIKNEEVLNNTLRTSNIMPDISKRQLGFFGHLKRKHKLEHLAAIRKIERKENKREKRTAIYRSTCKMDEL